mmetsp:Transcript_33610/g.92088  ORF Transcript_33610/g.92088 Transcript_33610/m.92088 type:complete len:114 (-) Transcript_33610:496-837(-)
MVRPRLLRITSRTIAQVAVVHEKEAAIDLDLDLSKVKFARKVKVASPNVDLADVLPLTLRSKSATLHVEVALQSISWHFLAGWGRQKLEFSTKASDHDTKQVGPARRSALLFA